MHDGGYVTEGKQLPTLKLNNGRSRNLIDKIRISKTRLYNYLCEHCYYI